MAHSLAYPLDSGLLAFFLRRFRSWRQAGPNGEYEGESDADRNNYDDEDAAAALGLAFHGALSQPQLDQAYRGASASLVDRARQAGLLRLP